MFIATLYITSVCCSNIQYSPLCSATHSNAEHLSCLPQFNNIYTLKIMSPTRTPALLATPPSNNNKTAASNFLHQKLFTQREQKGSYFMGPLHPDGSQRCLAELYQIWEGHRPIIAA